MTGEAKDLDLKMLDWLDAHVSGDSENNEICLHSAKVCVMQSCDGQNTPAYKLLFLCGKKSPSSEWR